MKITDMTDTLFDREMNRLLAEIRFWCTRLEQIGECTIKPKPVSYTNGTGEQPFPLALALKWVWDYARGTGKCPEELEEIIQNLCGILWSRIGSTVYSIPAEFWDTPLGFMAQLAEARAAMDSEEPLNAEQLAMMADVTPTRVKQLCATGDIPAEKTPRGKSAQLEWAIPAEVARGWLESRGK